MRETMTYVGLDVHARSTHAAAVDVATGELAALTLVPLRLRRFRLERPSAGDRAWLRKRLEEQYRRFGHRVVERDDAFALDWR